MIYNIPRPQLLAIIQIWPDLTRSDPRPTSNSGLRFCLWFRAALLANKHLYPRYSQVVPWTWTRWDRTCRCASDWSASATHRRTQPPRTSAGAGSYMADRLRPGRPSTRSAGARCSSSPGGSSRSWTVSGRPARLVSECGASWTPSWRCVYGLARGRWPLGGEALWSAVLAAPRRCRPSLLDRTQRWRQLRRCKHPSTESLGRRPTFVSCRQCYCWSSDDNRWM